MKTIEDIVDDMEESQVYALIIASIVALIFIAGLTVFAYLYFFPIGIAMTLAIIVLLFVYALKNDKQK